jgi:hypothetical protein
MTPDQIAFTNAFNNQRGLLAGFAKCWNRDELQLVRDGLYIGLASELLPVEYALVQETIVTNPSVATTRDSPAGFMTMIHVARTCPEWQALVDRLLELADRVDCDLPGIWKTLEDGRMEWLTAINGAQTLKSLLLEMLKRDSATNSVGDVSDAKMIWMYSLACNIPALEAERQKWAAAVQMTDPLRPLLKYQAQLWDARHEHWRALDVGVQAAAERGGSTVEATWSVGFDVDEGNGRDTSSH